MDNMIYPLTFVPIFKDYLWGGRNLETKLGRRIPSGIIAESWEIAGHRNGSSIVSNGPMQGLTLPQVQEQLGVQLVGSRNRYALEQGKFPLLIKLLDANQWLSVQVHPDDRYAKIHEGEYGKSEMWVVLHAEPDAEIIFGFKAGVTKEAFTQAIAEERSQEMLHRQPVKAGDVILVPAGSIHALGPGVIIAEIQQNSDTTYRIYDWGRPRAIHVEKALDVLNFDLVTPKPIDPELLSRNQRHQELIGHCPHFQTERIYLPKDHSMAEECNGETFEIWGVLEGKAQIRWDKRQIELNAISWILLPASLGEFEVVSQDESVLLRISTPA